jgi:hypothetical protein
MMEYKIVKADTPDEVEKQVNQYIVDVLVDDELDLPE